MRAVRSGVSIKVSAHGAELSDCEETRLSKDWAEVTNGIHLTPSEECELISRVIITRLMRTTGPI